MTLNANPLDPSQLMGDNSSENITLSPGQLTPFSKGLWMLDGNDTVQGSSDGELLFGNSGNDRLLGGGGNDKISGGRGDDDLGGESGNDTLLGDRNRDFLDGGNGDDFLRGGEGVDLLVGGEGNDTLIGDKDVDFYKGNQGQDLFVFRRDQAGNKVLSFELPDGIIVDFNPVEDLIGLTSGLTPEDIKIEAIKFDTNNPLLNLLDSGILEEGTSFLEKGGISRSTLDPNGDGIVEGMGLRIADNNALLGVVINVNSSDLQNRLVSYNLL